MAELRKLPIGIENFEKICQEDFYYVDKTRLIEQLLEQCGEVNFLTCPRRFGKSLNMSMFQHFFEIGSEKTLYTNISSTLNIIKAIKEQPDPDKVHFAYVGTVAMTGSRLDPVQFGRIGDPMNPSINDYYAVSKVFSEATVFKSGLKYGVSIRQTGQHPSAEGAGEEPIVFHQPANNVLEWSTALDSGICMANLQILFS